MPARIDMNFDRPTVNGQAANGYSTDFFDSALKIFFWFVDRNFFVLVASVADLTDLLQSEPQDDLIVGLRNAVDNIFSSPTVYSLAYVLLFFLSSFDE